MLLGSRKRTEAVAARLFRLRYALAATLIISQSMASAQAHDHRRLQRTEATSTYQDDDALTLYGNAHGARSRVVVVGLLLQRRFADAQHAAIHQRYPAARDEPRAPREDITGRALPAVLTGFLSIGILAFGYMRLRREVRQRQQTEQALRTQLSFRTTLLDMVPFPIGVRDSQGFYLDVNVAAEEAMGLSRDVVIGRTIEECAALSNMPGTLTSHILTTTQRDMTYEAVRVDFSDAYGQSRHGLYWHRPFHDDTGAVAGTVGAVVDVTALLEAERKAHETETRLEEVTHNLPATVFQMRRDSGGALSYQYLGSNRTLLPDIRRGGLRLDRGHASLVLPRREMQHLVSALDESARSLRPLDATFKVGEAAGIQWLKIRAVPRREPDGATLFNGYWSDTTCDQLRTAELEAARVAAESASEAKDRFVAMMSHEIRTPMSGVLGLVELLSRTELRDEQATMVGMVHESAGALLQILDDVLDYSKIQADRLTIEDAPFDLREVADVVLGLLAMRAHQKSLALRCRVSGHVAARHRGDSVRLRQILFNLVGNAIKFTASGSVSLAVELDADVGASRIESPTDNQSVSQSVSQSVRITVIDTGIGIDASVIPTLFSPFVQGESSTSRRFGGTGLGLVICRKLVTLMGGDIAIHSKPGAGTTVTVRLTLPVHLRRHTDAADPATTKATAATTAVVLVRDMEAAAAIADGVVALGARVDVLDPAASRASPTPGDSGCADIVFVDEDEAPPACVGTAAVIRVSRQPEPAGYRAGAAGVYVSINPLSYRGLRAAWHEALERDALSDANACAAADAVPAPRGPVRTREQAIRDGVLILVAEDNPVNRYLIRSQLESFGCACDVTEDGAEALAAYERNDYALLITDCQMPRVDGYALASSIRKRERQEHSAAGGACAARKAARLPIVALTASVGSPEWNRCIEAGMDDYLCKPAQRDVLHACLLRWAPLCLRSAEEQLDVELKAAGHAASLSAAGPDDTLDDADHLPPFDWEAIHRSTGGASRSGVLMEIVGESLRSEAKTLRDLLSDADSTRLERWVHKMNGAASMLHYQPLLDATAQFATALTPGDAAGIRAAGAKLLRTLETIATHATHLANETNAGIE
ncbi:ATP-binding protein [Paraburkholderia sp. PREW-6R]|uniref:ATP-binding protein n=1 Tax=Paraburkholderia sp. PREW-6R TaxID=3141544 RepID=UPI0031F4F41A